MTGRPQRRRFQFHLATAVAMMVVVGAWVGLNVRCPFIPDESAAYTGCIASTKTGAETTLSDNVPPTGGLTQVRFVELPEETRYGLLWPFLHKQGWVALLYLEPEWQFFLWPFVFDLLFVLGLLSATFVLSEWLIRRRARRTTPA